MNSPKPESEKKRSKSSEKKDERAAFKPSSVVIDAPFVADQDLFGEDPTGLKAVSLKSMEVKNNHLLFINL